MNIEKAQLSIKQLKEIQIQANEARGFIIKMTSLANSGHPGGSMSSIDFLLTLYNMINIDPQNPKMETRDRVIISHGHTSPAAYSTLASCGFFNIDDAISQFRLAGSIFEGHVEPNVPGIEWASGNLGQGLSAGCGFALASKLQNIDNHTFVLMGDGEQQKGQLGEARRFADKYHLNITAFVDYNQLQISGNINKVMPQHILDNYLSDGWDAIEIDGHDLIEIRDAILDAVQNEKPTVIIGHTIMGKGVSFMENKEKYHGSPLSEEQLTEALKELDLENDIEKYKKLRSEFNASNSTHNNNSVSLDFDIDLGEPIIYKEKTDNRSAWGNAIADIASKNKNAPLVVFDCDLQGSVKTKEFEDVLPQNFIQGGIMEHNTAVVAAAVSKERLQVFFPDFGVFGVDETYNQHRLSDINNTNLKIITTHVGLDVGEDGKTHQCIDYFGVMKNLYNFKTIIPADPNQTDRVIRYISGKYGNFLIPMGRSKLELIKKENGDIFFGKNYKFEYGKADLLRDGTTAALFVMGTLTGRAMLIADELSELGISLQVWNISCPNELDEEALKQAVKTETVFTYEDHNVNTGIGNSIADKMMQMGLHCKFRKFGVEDYALSGNSDDVFKHCKLDVDSIVKRIREVLEN
ncbi:MAG: transketolase [Candidatus Cloacimonetes bacterium]|jgi:transketolase|nr:transketolase [Candidatus Cloacimonadota bacterium]